MSAAGQTEDGKLLQKDLRWVAELGLRRAYMQPNDQDETKHPTLARIVKAVAGERAWRDGPSLALIQVMREAIDAIPERFERRPRANSAGGPERHMAEIMYGYRDNETEPRHFLNGSEATEVTYDHDRLPAALKLVGYQTAEAGKLATKDIRLDLVDSLLAMERKAIDKAQARVEEDTEAGESLSEVRVVASDYVPRLKLYEAIDAAIADGEHVIGLVGEGGVGKSTLAKGYALERFGVNSTYIFVSFVDDRKLAVGLRREFVRLGLSADGLSEGTAYLKLDELLSSPDACPKYVILDNVDKREQLELLQPLPTSSTFFLTTRDSHVLPEKAKPIHVGELSDREALEAITLKLPDVTSEELEGLRRLGGRALAIDIACAVLRRSENEERRKLFLNILRRHVVEALGVASATVSMPSIEAMYRALIEYFESDKYTARAIRLLELVIAVRFMERGIGLSSAQSIENIIVNMAISEERYQPGVDLLERFNIVRFRCYNSSGGELRHKYVVLHPLTEEVFLHVFEDVVPQQCDVLVERYLDEAFSLDWDKESAELSEALRLSVLSRSVRGDDVRSSTLRELYLSSDNCAILVRQSRDHWSSPNFTRLAKRVLRVMYSAVDYFDSLPPASHPFMGKSNGARWRNFRRHMSDLEPVLAQSPEEEALFLEWG